MNILHSAVFGKTLVFSDSDYCIFVYDLESLKQKTTFQCSYVHQMEFLANGLLMVFSISRISIFHCKHKKRFRVRQVPDPFDQIMIKGNDIYLLGQGTIKKWDYLADTMVIIARNDEFLLVPFMNGFLSENHKTLYFNDHILIPRQEYTKMVIKIWQEYVLCVQQQSQGTLFFITDHHHIKHQWHGGHLCEKTVHFDGDMIGAMDIFFFGWYFFTWTGRIICHLGWETYHIAQWIRVSPCTILHISNDTELKLIRGSIFTLHKAMMALCFKAKHNISIWNYIKWK